MWLSRGMRQSFTRPRAMQCKCVAKCVAHYTHTHNQHTHGQTERTHTHTHTQDCLISVSYCFIFWLQLNFVNLLTFLFLQPLQIPPFQCKIKPEPNTHPEDSDESLSDDDSQHHRNNLIRRPSYNKIFTEISGPDISGNLHSSTPTHHRRRPLTASSTPIHILQSCKHSCLLSFVSSTLRLCLVHQLSCFILCQCS